MATDWSEVAKVVPGIVGMLTGIVGTVTGCLALYFNRRDARRAREAAGPTAIVMLNPHPEEGGWYIIKLTFQNVRRAFEITRVTVRFPKMAVIARRSSASGTNMRDGNGAQAIDVKWHIDPAKASNPATGAAVAHLNIRLKAMATPDDVQLLLTGHYVSGLQTALSIECRGRR